MILSTIIYFIRHAEPNYENHDDLTRELTENGCRASQQLVERFKGIEIDSFYSSPYKRSLDTILPLANSRVKKIVTDMRLRERKLSDNWVDDFIAEARKQWGDFSYKLPNSESLTDVQERNIAALKDILVKEDGKTIVIGTHGTALSTIIHYYQPDFRFEQFNKIKHHFPWIAKFVFKDDEVSIDY